MKSIRTVIAHQSQEHRQRLCHALGGNGIETIEAESGEQTVELAAKTRPAIVLASREITGNGPAGLQEKLGEKLIRQPPLVVLDEQTSEDDEELAARFIFVLPPAALTPARLVLLLIAWEVGGEPGDGVDSLYGDLARVSVGDLLRLLLRYRMSCRVELSVGPETTIRISEGQVVDARWGRIAGQKAFNRISRLRAGSFILTPDTSPAQTTISVDLPTLVSDADDALLKLEELYRSLPSLRSKVAAGSSPPAELTAVEQAVLNAVTGEYTLAELVDRVAVPDWQVLQAVAWLRDRDLLVLQEPEHRIHVVTDSTCDLQPALVRRYGITVVPLSVMFGERRFTDGVDLHTDEFYRMLSSSQMFPKTSPPKSDDFLETYRRLVPSGDIISIHISRKQSLTAGNADQAVETGAQEFGQLRRGGELPAQPLIRVVDSWSNSVGLGLLAIFAARMAQRGVKLDEIVDRLQDIRTRIQFLFIVDTLKFLQMGGRIGKAQALLGTLLGIKPILGMQEGEVVTVEKVRGGRNVQPRVVEIFKERVDPGRPVFATLSHAVAPKWAGKLRELLEQDFDIIELLSGEIGPVVGSHTGPGTVGCILFQPNESELELLRPEE